MVEVGPAALARRIPELEPPAPPEASRSPEDLLEEPAEGSTPDQGEDLRTAPERAPWWRRIFE